MTYNLNILLPEIFLTLSIFSILMIGVFIRKSFNLVFNLSSVIIVITLVMILNLPTQPEKIFLGKKIENNRYRFSRLYWRHFLS